MGCSTDSHVRLIIIEGLELDTRREHVTITHNKARHVVRIGIVAESEGQG